MIKNGPSPNPDPDRGPNVHPKPQRPPRTLSHRYYDLGRVMAWAMLQRMPIPSAIASPLLIAELLEVDPIGCNDGTLGHHHTSLRTTPTSSPPTPTNPSQPHQLNTPTKPPPHHHNTTPSLHHPHQPIMPPTYHPTTPGTMYFYEFRDNEKVKTNKNVEAEVTLSYTLN